jgi:4-hydroxy-tetrahydrodipicolinate synthase
MTVFSGLSAFPLTPASPAGEVRVDDLRGLVRAIEDGGADSVGLLGSTGTYMFLTRAERRRAVAAAVGEARSIPVMVGVGALRTDDARDLAQDAAREGASGLLLAPVSYSPLTDEEVFQHFAVVASATDVPICIYDNPTTTHFAFKPELVARIAELPTVAAIKLPLPEGGDLAGELDALRRAAPGLSIGYSGDWGCKDALLAGADCWYSVAGGLFTARAVALAKAARAGSRPDADRHHDAFGPLWDLFREQGGLRVMYAAANLLGRTNAPLPILPLAGEALRRVEAAIDGL